MSSETSSTGLDTAKLIVALIVVVAGFFGFYHFEAESTLMATLVMVGACIAAIVIAVQTTQGRDVWSFIQAAKTEVGRVVWPTQKETRNATMIIVVVVIIIGIMLSLFDMFLSYVIAIVTGQG